MVQLALELLLDLEIFTPWYKELYGLGGLNLLLAFNGVCKLYLDGEHGVEGEM